MWISVDSPFFAPSLLLMLAGTMAVATTATSLAWIVPRQRA